MAYDEGALQIRSYRVCFRLERRIHKIDRWRIPVPYGVPLSGLAYSAAALLAVLVLSRLPVTGWFLGTLHPWFRYAVLPGLAGWALIRWKIDGRSVVATAGAWLRWYRAPKRLTAFREAVAPGPSTLDAITVAPDERASRLRRGVIEGQGRIILRYPCTATVRGRTLRIAQEPGDPLWQGKQVRLRSGQRVVVAG